MFLVGGCGGGGGHVGTESARQGGELPARDRETPRPHGHAAGNTT